jgi:hypothetical protein
VAIFLRHYLEILEDATGMSDGRTEMERLARELYRRHKKVLDFVMEHGAGSDFAIAARSLFGEDPDRFKKIKIDNNEFVFGGLGNSAVSFLPVVWYEALGKDACVWQGCKNWWLGFPLITWLQLWSGDDGVKGTLWLYAEVGPLSDHEFRKTLIESIQAAATQNNLKIAFQRGAASEGKLYSKFLKQNNVQIADVHDAEKLASAMKKLLNDFQKEFQIVGALLSQFLKHGVPSI